MASAAGRWRRFHFPHHPEDMLISHVKSMEAVPFAAVLDNVGQLLDVENKKKSVQPFGGLSSPESESA